MSETPEQPTGIAWGDPISPQRLAQLRELFELQLERVELPDFGIEQTAFSSEVLTGADVFWIAVIALSGSDHNLSRSATALRDPELVPWADGWSHNSFTLHLEGAFLPNAQLRSAQLDGAQLQGAILDGAQLQGADLVAAQLQGANLGQAELQGANLFDANLQRANMDEADLKGANLRQAHMQEASLNGAKLEGANLHKARLEGAHLRAAHLERTDLGDAQLEKATLSNAYLDRADLRGASFNKASWLNDASLEGVSLDQVTFDNTNLTVVPWEKVHRLGDEREARKTKGVRKKSEAFHVAARAYRSLSVALRSQGLSADATRFHYRAELMERKSLFWQMLARLRSRRFYTAPAYFGRWLFSWLLGTFAGYGDYFGRLLLTYVIVVSAFAGLMFFASGRVVSFDAIRDVFVLSVTSFHGRGVQPPGLHLNDGLATLTAVEAFFGLLIEGIFIAAFTRRVTGN